MQRTAEVGVIVPARNAERFLGANEAQTLKMMLRRILEAIPSGPPAPAGDEH